VVAALQRQGPGLVVDVGCGTGLLTTRLAELGPRMIGCDLSLGMLHEAVGRSRVPAWVQADAMALPLSAACVDAIVCTESFHWYPDQMAALGEFARVLAPGGRLYVALINPRTNGLSELTHRWSVRTGQPLYWPTSARMRSMVTEAGMRVVRQQRLLRLPSGPLLPPVLTIAERP
jgi:ubiquinone/menaquinone biosynthesis C-methylase UbiE